MTESELHAIFGGETSRLLRACKKVMHDWLYPYDGCYRAPYPNIHEIRKEIGNDYITGPEFLAEREKFINRWYEEHPGEKEKEEQSRKEWERKRDNHFKELYGIAKRHKVCLVWCGNDCTCRCENQWEIIRADESIGRICL